MNMKTINDLCYEIFEEKYWKEFFDEEPDEIDPKLIEEQERRRKKFSEDTRYWLKYNINHEPCCNCKYYRPFINGIKDRGKEHDFSNSKFNDYACHYCLDTNQSRYDSPTVDGYCKHFKKRD